MGDDAVHNISRIIAKCRRSDHVGVLGRETFKLPTIVDSSKQHNPVEDIGDKNQNEIRKKSKSIVLQRIATYRLKAP